jgi:hypothetical protein
MEFCMLIPLQRMNNFNKTIFVKNQKYEHEGQLKVNISYFLLWR